MNEPSSFPPAPEGVVPGAVPATPPSTVLPPPPPPPAPPPPQFPPGSTPYPPGAVGGPPPGYTPYTPYNPAGYGYGAGPDLTKEGNKVLVLGLVSLIICGPIGLAAIWEGSKVRKAAFAAGVPEPGTSKAGRILGIIALVWMIVVIAMIIGAAAAAPDAAPTYYTGY